MAGLGKRAKVLLVTVPIGLSVVGWLGLWWFHDRWMVSDCRPHRIRTDLVALGDGLASWAAKHGGTYPSSLAELLDRDALGHQYLAATRLPRDPWNREYVYVPGNPPNVLTYGRDGVQGGTGEDADVEYQSLVAGIR